MLFAFDQPFCDRVSSIGHPMATAADVDAALVLCAEGIRVPIILPIDSFVKFTDFEKFSLLYYT